MEPVVFSVIGILSIGFGTYLLFNSARVTKSIDSAQRKNFGSFGESIASKSRPWAMVIPGIFGIVIGLVMLAAVVASLMQ